MNNLSRDAAFSDLEAAAAALSRGLSARFDWSQLVEAARDLALQPIDGLINASSDAPKSCELPAETLQDHVSNAENCDENHSSHGAAARVLDGAAQFAPQSGPAQSRELGLWAAAAFAQTGNFPSSTVVVRRTFVRTRGHDAQTAAILCAIAPILASQLKADSPVAAHLDRFFQSGDAADAARALEAWNGVVLAAGERFPRGLWQLASRGFRAALLLGTSRALAASGACFPAGFEAKLSARVPVLLPPQARALRDGFLRDGANALAALAPGTGKTLLGELFLASCLGASLGASQEVELKLALADVPCLQRHGRATPAALTVLPHGASPPILARCAVRSTVDAAGVALPCLWRHGTSAKADFSSHSTSSNPANWAVFIVPYVALGRGVASAIAAHFPSEVQIHRWLGRANDEDDADFSSGSHLVIATPERLDAHLRRHSSSWKTLRGVVCDEAHLIADGARGALLEGLLTRLKLAPSCRARLLLLSAALGDTGDLAGWIGAKHVLGSRFTPTARRIAWWRGDGRLEWHGDLSGAGLQPLGVGKIAPPHPLLRSTGSWPQVRRFEPMARENVAHLTRELLERRGGPILCLCATRRATRELALFIGANLSVSTEVSGHRARAIEAIEARHRPLLPLAGLLKRGVAWHNASLPQEVRAAIEAGVAEGEISVVAATSTLAEGVDLPFRLTVLSDWLRWDDEGQRPISPALFRNIAGRCGRAGSFTEGDTLVYDNPLGDEQFTAPDRRAALQHRLYLEEEPGAARSSLELDEAQSTRTALEATLETQFLAALGEAESATGDFARQFLAATYLARRDAAKLEFWQGRARLWLQNWDKEGLLSRDGERTSLSPRGKAWRATDFSPATCRRLLGALETLPDLDFSGVCGLSKLNAHLWRALGASPEAGSEIARFFGPRSRFVATPADLETLGASWLRGTALEAIFAALPRVARADFEGLDAWVEGSQNENETESPDWSAQYERFLDFGRAGLETWTPRLWSAAAVLSPLAGRVARRVDWRSGAALWAEGVDSAWAARAIASGAPGTRRGVAAVGRLWPVSPVSSVDLLGLSRLNRDDERAKVEAAFEAALREVGGRHCVAGRNVLALRDWVWARAGLNK